MPRHKILPRGFRMAHPFTNQFYNQCRPGKRMPKPLYSQAKSWLSLRKETGNRPLDTPSAEANIIMIPYEI